MKKGFTLIIGSSTYHRYFGCGSVAAISQIGSKGPLGTSGRDFRFCQESGGILYVDKRQTAGGGSFLVG